MSAPRFDPEGATPGGLPSCAIRGHHAAVGNPSPHPGATVSRRTTSGGLSGNPDCPQADPTYGANPGKACQEEAGFLCSDIFLVILRNPHIFLFLMAYHSWRKKRAGPSITGATPDRWPGHKEHKELIMKYQFLATNGSAPVDMELLSSRFGGRMFVTEGEILSWFAENDTSDDESSDGIRHDQNGLACV